MPAGNFTSLKRTWYSIDKDTGKVKSKDAEKNIQLHDYVEGILVGIKFEEGEYEGRPANKFVFTLATRDGSEVDVLRLGEDSNCAYDALNILASVKPTDEFGWIRFTPYPSEFNGKMIIHMALRRNGEKLQRRYKPDEIPKVVTQKVGRQEVQDKSDKQAFFLDIATVLRDRIAAFAGESNPAFDKLSQPLAGEDPDESSIPF